MTIVDLWRKIQKENFTNVNKLADFLELDEKNRSKLAHKKKFSLSLPMRLAEKICKNSLNDPIALQFVPLIYEEINSVGFISDPVCDQNFKKCKSVLHKYSGRALLISCSACAMHCRYCFRQNFNYENGNFHEEIDFLNKDHSIYEVILSGGDPLALSDSKLSHLIEKLSNINHIKIIRFHTRFPIGIPERITENFLSILRRSPKQIIFILHVNHVNEFDDDVFASLKKIRLLGIPILSQSVLLKNVNDNAETLKNLYLKEIENGIIPYYLHQLDKVSGASHFDVPKELGLQIIDKLKQLLPGYAIPKYVEEIPWATSKTHILHEVG